MLDFPDRSTAPLTAALYEELTSRVRQKLAGTKAGRLIDHCTLIVVPFEQCSVGMIRRGTGLFLLVNRPYDAQWQLDLYDLKDRLAIVGETFFQLSGLPHLLLKRQHNETILGQRHPDLTWHFLRYPEKP